MFVGLIYTWTPQICNLRHINLTTKKRLHVSSAALSDDSAEETVQKLRVFWMEQHPPLVVICPHHRHQSLSVVLKSRLTNVLKWMKQPLHNSTCTRVPGSLVPLWCSAEPKSKRCFWPRCYSNQPTCTCTYPCVCVQPRQSGGWVSSWWTLCEQSGALSAWRDAALAVCQ